MDFNNSLPRGLKYIFNQPRTYELLLTITLLAFCLTILSFAYAMYQPAAEPVYYNLDASGQLQPVTTVQASDWLSQSDKAVLGEQIER